MKIIVIASQKGGSGKTTLVAHLAVEIERAEDARVFIVDTDKQGTLSLWHERRQSETPSRIEVPVSKLESGLKTIEEQADYCLIDTAPTISDQTASLIVLADLVLIPVRPSPADLWSVGETVALVKKSGKPFLFVLTQVKTQASITAQAVASLSQHGRISQAFIADRVLYASAMTGGLTAPEISSKGPTSQEIIALWSDIKSFIHQIMKE